MKDGEILTEYQIKKINDIKKDIEGLEADGENVVIYEEVDELIQKISTRNARFNNMALDEKLKEIGNLIEYLLKDKYTEQQKLFMVEFGIIICNLIYNELKKHNS